MMVTTASSAQAITKYCSWVDWKRHRVLLQGPAPCPLPEHEVEVMHHIGNPDGMHYCPTGFIWCPVCCAIGEEPEPHECTKWGEP